MQIGQTCTLTPLRESSLNTFPEFNEIAKKLEVEMVFAGIPVPEHKFFMVLKAHSFEAVRTLMVESGLVQTNTITIRQTESL